MAAPDLHLRFMGGSAMKKKSQDRCFGERSRYARGQHIRKDPSEKRAEDRLEKLGTLASVLRAVSYPIWQANTDHICETVGKLRMKEEAARWMLRIMHHFGGPARETLLSFLERSLDDLERTVKSEMHAEVAA
jgi:hypothetical protein